MTAPQSPRSPAAATDRDGGGGAEPTDWVSELDACVEAAYWAGWESGWWVGFRWCLAGVVVGLLGFGAIALWGLT